MNQTTIVFVLLALIAIGLFVAGVYVLLGIGWSLLAGAVSACLAASFVAKGARVA